MRRIRAGTWLIGLTFALVAPRAEAIPTLLFGVDGGSPTTCLDQTACDQNPVAGAVTFVGILEGGFTVNVVTGITTPVLPGVELNLNSVNVQTSGGVHDLRIVFTETGFTDVAGFVTEVGGVLVAPAGSTLTAASWFADLISLEDPIATLGPFGPGAFAGSLSSGPALSAPYNLSLVVDIRTTGPGSASFDFTLTGEERIIPEPASAALFAAGALVVGTAVRRRA
jgi:hypothetical protein